jgi:hypothetical protein
MYHTCGTAAVVCRCGAASHPACQLCTSVHNTLPCLSINCTQPIIQRPPCCHPAACWSSPCLHPATAPPVVLAPFPACSHALRLPSRAVRCAGSPGTSVRREAVGQPGSTQGPASRQQAVHAAGRAGRMWAGRRGLHSGGCSAGHPRGQMETAPTALRPALQPAENGQMPRVHAREGTFPNFI